MERGTWDVGLGDLGARGLGEVGTLGHGDAGRWGLEDAGTWGLGDVVREDFGTRRRAGIRGRDKQITPDFCAELVKYFLYKLTKYTYNLINRAVVH